MLRKRIVQRPPVKPANVVIKDGTFAGLKVGLLDNSFSSAWCVQAAALKDCCRGILELTRYVCCIIANKNDSLSLYEFKYSV